MLALPLRVPTELIMTEPPPTRVFCKRGRIRLIPKGLTFSEGAKRRQADETKRDSLGAGNACRTKVRERAEWGYHPRGDRKSAEVIEDRGDSGLPWRKRVRNLMIMLGL